MSDSSSSTAATPSPPPQRSRRSGAARARARRATPLAESFKEYVDSAPPQEVSDLSAQLQAALGSIANNPNPNDDGAGPLLTLGSNGRVMRNKIGISASAPNLTFRSSMLKKSFNAPGANAEWGQTPTSTNSNGFKNGRFGLSAPVAEGAPSPGSSLSNSMVQLPRRPSGDEFYAPKSSSRRNSAAGSLLAVSMKVAAQRALAELGEISDDDGSDDDILQLGVLDNLDGLEDMEEEKGGSFNQGMIREDSTFG